MYVGVQMGREVGSLVCTCVHTFFPCHDCLGMVTSIACVGFEGASHFLLACDKAQKSEPRALALHDPARSMLVA